MLAADILSFDHQNSLGGKNFYRVRKLTDEKMCDLSQIAQELGTLMVTLNIKHSTIARCDRCTGPALMMQVVCKQNEPH